MSFLNDSPWAGPTKIIFIDLSFDDGSTPGGPRKPPIPAKVITGFTKLQPGSRIKVAEYIDLTTEKDNDFVDLIDISNDEDLGCRSCERSLLSERFAKCCGCVSRKMDEILRSRS